MKIIIFLAIVVSVFVWYDTSLTSSADIDTSINTDTQRPLNSNDDDSLDFEQPTYIYRCDGRVYCSQMTSCEEAKFFLKNCPNPKMDGNNDGIPCERQWCH